MLRDLYSSLIVIFLFTLGVSNGNISKSQANQVLKFNSRSKRANENKYDEYKRDDLNRECGEEFCDKEELSEALERTHDWEKFMKNYLSMNKRERAINVISDKWQVYRDFKLDKRDLCPPVLKNSDLKMGLDILYDPAEISKFYKLNTEGRLGRNGMNWQAYFRKLDSGKLQVLMNVTYTDTTVVDLYHTMILRQFREQWDYVTPHRIMGLTHEYKFNNVSFNFMYEQKVLPIFGDVGVFWIHQLNGYPYRVKKENKEYLSWCIKSISDYCLETECIKFPFYDKKSGDTLQELDKEDHLKDDMLCFYLRQENNDVQLWSLAQGTPIIPVPETALKIVLPRELGKGHRKINETLKNKNVAKKLKNFCGSKNAVACERHKLVCGRCDKSVKIDFKDLVDRRRKWGSGSCEKGISNEP